MPNRQQAIIWTNAHPIHPIYGSKGRWVKVTANTIGLYMINQWLKFGWHEKKNWYIKVSWQMFVKAKLNTIRSFAIACWQFYTNLKPKANLNQMKRNRCQFNKRLIFSWSGILSTTPSAKLRSILLVSIYQNKLYLSWWVLIQSKLPIRVGYFCCHVLSYVKKRGSCVVEGGGMPTLLS